MDLDDIVTIVALILAGAVIFVLAGWAITLTIATYGTCSTGQVRVVEDNFRGCLPWEAVYGKEATK